MVSLGYPQAYRGDGHDRPREYPLPPAYLPLLRAGRLRKQWRYVSIWSEDVLICAAQIAVGPFRQEFWAVWDRAGHKLWERTRLYPWSVKLPPNRVLVRDGAIMIDLQLEEQGGVEVLTPDGNAYTWTRKQIVRAHGVLHLPGGRRQVEATALIDDNAGYHRRHTSWCWSGGAGYDTRGRSIAWSVIVGLNDRPHNSERTIWIDGRPHEIGQLGFADDLSFVAFDSGEVLNFHEEAARARRDNLLVVRSSYRQPFGSFSGTLPGGIELRQAYGVMERHDAIW